MKFKVLMIGQSFVNEKMLNKGIYATTTPALHFEGFTQDDLEKLWENYAAIANVPFENIKENISKCQLKTIEIIIKN